MLSIECHWKSILKPFALFSILCLWSVSAIGDRDPARPWDVPIEVIYGGGGRDVVVENARCRLSEFRHYEVLGEIYNAGDSIVTAVLFAGSMLAPDETVLATSERMSLLQTLAPGERSPFRLAFYDAYGLVSACLLEISWQETTIPPGREATLQFHRETGYVGSGWGYCIAALLTNDSPLPIRDVTVVFTAYAEDGSVLDFACATGSILVSRDLSRPCSKLEDSLQLLLPGDTVFLKMYVDRAPQLIDSVVGVAEYVGVPPPPDNGAKDD